MTYPKDTTLADYQPLVDNLKSLASSTELSITAFGEEWVGRTARSAFNEIELLQDFICEQRLAFNFTKWKREIKDQE